MTHYLPQRRILTFPAIHPCEDISPSTLLTSLINLSRDIVAHRSSSFPIHRLSARESIRQVSAILEFLEDLRCRCSPLPDSLVVAFSELHITFQKLRLLLHDCSGRRGSRLWILMRSDRVSCEFRMLFRSIATVLDVVPLESVDSSGDMKEVVLMVARQAWRARGDADARAATAVRSVLKSFENGEWPDMHSVGLVLNRLRIRSWADCHDEVSFLESEISSCSDGEEGEVVSLLSSLMGFMVYSRAVFFDATPVSDRTSRREDTKLLEAAMQHVNPDDLRCPISLELMTDPVTVSTGQTYDRRSITRWLDAGCLTCPVTGDKLANPKLVPNAAVRNLVEHFCKINNIHPTEPSNHRKRDLSRTATPGSEAAAGAIRMAASFLVEKKLTVGSKEEEQRKAAYEIRLLTKSSLFNRSTFVECGAVQCLLNLISSLSLDAVAQEHAVAALLNISKLPLGRIAIFEYGGLGAILNVLNSGLKVEAQQNAAAILFYLSSVDEYRREIGEASEAIPALVELLRSGTHRGKKNAAVALFGLLSCPGNHSRVFAAGGLPVILDIILGERDDLVTDLVAILAKLAERPEGANIILRSSAVPSLVEVLRTSPSRSGKEYCVATLWSLCNSGGAKVARMLDGQPSLMSSLYSLLTDGTPHAAKKARSLLNHLHHFQDDACSAMTISPTVGDHYFVHAQ